MKFITYFRQQRDRRGVTIGNMTRMIFDLEEEMPGAGKMLIDQIPDRRGVTIGNMTRMICFTRKRRTKCLDL